MSRLQTRTPSGWRRWLRIAVLLALLPIGLWLVQRVYFWATPAKPSAQRLALAERVQAYNVDSISGLNLIGFLAPPDLDPLAFGRCRLEAARAVQRKTRLQAMGNDGQPAELSTPRSTACLQGKTQLVPVAHHASVRLGPQTKTTEWAALAATAVHPVLLQRFSDTLDSPPRTWKIESTIDFAMSADAFPSLVAINTQQAASAQQLWRSGDRRAAETQLHRLLDGWSAFAKDSVLAAMLATRAQTDVLLAIQSLTRDDASSTSDQDWAALIAITESTGAMDLHLGEAIENEWLLSQAMYQDIDLHLEHPTGYPNRLLSQVAYDREDTLNRQAALLIQAAVDAQQAASGLPPRAQPPEHCSGFPLIQATESTACALLGRNGMGATLTRVAQPSYAAFGTRIADLRNLAAATRLTLEAHRQGLQGEALAQFVTEAPAHMRDLFTQEPFACDPRQRRLTITLREPNPLLGDGTYTLAF